MPATITINGNTTLSTYNAPGAYVNVQSPSPSGAATAQFGLGIIEGTCSWGPKNQLMFFSDVPSLYAAGGKQTTATHDAIAEAIQACSQSKNLALLRVSDGTDVAASVVLKDTGAVNGGTATAKYTGTEGDNITIALATGFNSTSGSPTVSATITRKGYASETFANISAPAASGAFWTNFANAVNNGIAGQRGPSNLITFAAASSTAPPALGTFALAGGTNGDSSVTSANLLGTDGTTGRTGAYAIRGSGATAFGIAGLTDSTQWASLATLCESEGIVGIGCVPNGTSITTAINDKQSANLNSDWFKVFDGDSWLVVNDPTLGQMSVSPIGLQVGLRCSLNPSDSTLNKPQTGFGNAPFSQVSGFGQTYSQGQVAQLQNNGFDAITNYLQGYLTNTTGVMSSGVQDAYPVMTSYIARNLGAIAQKFIGFTQGSRKGDPTRKKARAAIAHFFATIQDQIDGLPDITLDSSNNTPTTEGEGFLIGSVRCRYLGIVQQFVLNYQGGATVVTASTPSAQ